MLTHLSLFSGIGGLDLAAEMAGFFTVGQCEWADYPAKVLEKHWPDVPRWRDIHGLTARDFYRKTGLKEGQLTCISGGFPCQPHSLAGKRKASDDERDLWPEMRRVIGEIKPRWVVAENVRGLLSSEDGRFFRNVLRDFAIMGYSVGWGVTSAAAVGAIHRRERLAIITHSNIVNVEGSIDKPLCRGAKVSRVFYSGGVEEWAGRCSLYQPKLCRAFNGFPNQVDRLKCLGNAVVPQQFYPIFKAIADIENQSQEEGT